LNYTNANEVPLLALSVPRFPKEKYGKVIVNIVVKPSKKHEFSIEFPIAIIKKTPVPAVDAITKLHLGGHAAEYANRYTELFEVTTLWMAEGQLRSCPSEYSL
jgi:hypothetical protein